MIAKQIKGKDFYGVLAYNQKKIDKDQGCVIDSNIVKGSVVEQTKEFNIVRQLRPNLAKAVYHTSLNLPYSDKLSDEQFGSLARDYLDGMGFNENQYIVYKHNDQEHSHIHIVANRVKYSGDVVSDSQDYKRSEALIRKLEKKYDLTELVQKNENVVLSNGEIEKCLRTGNVPERLELNNIITGILKQNLVLQQFLIILKAKGVQTKLNQSSSGTISGISFEFKNITYKGSKVHRNLSWNNLKKVLNYEQNRINPVVSKFAPGDGENKKESSNIIYPDDRNAKENRKSSTSDMEKNKSGEKLNKNISNFRFKR